MSGWRLECGFSWTWENESSKSKGRDCGWRGLWSVAGGGTAQGMSWSWEVSSLAGATVL